MKIDRIEQTVEVQEINFNYQIKNINYTITPIGEGKATLKTNPGKTLNNGINLGAEPNEAKEINNKILKGLNVRLLKNNNIEYCIDISTNFKLIDNRHILKTFLKALEINKYKSGKVDFKIEKNKWIDKASLKGLKGYKTSRALKIYSKCEEQGINDFNGDLIRLELILGARALEQNKIEDISDVEKAKQELKEFLDTMLKVLPEKMNRYSIITKMLVNLFLKEL